VAGASIRVAEHWNVRSFTRRFETLVLITCASTITAGRPAHCRSALFTVGTASPEQYETRRPWPWRTGQKLDSVYKPAPPKAVLTDTAWETAVESPSAVIDLKALHKPTGPNVLDAGGVWGVTLHLNDNRKTV